MSSIGTDDFLEDVLDFIEQGKVIPVIGEHAVSFGEGILRERCPVPGGAVRDLASIAAFNLYLTTTFDPLLEGETQLRAFRRREEHANASVFLGAANKDLPARRSLPTGLGQSCFECVRRLKAIHARI